MKDFQFSIHTFEGDYIALTSIKNYIKGFCNYLKIFIKSSLDNRESYKISFIGEITKLLAEIENVIQSYGIMDLSYLDKISGHIEIWFNDGQENIRKLLFKCLCKETYI